MRTTYTHPGSANQYSFMSNITTKLNLSGLKCVIQKKKGKSGDIDCLVIPIDQNHLFRGEKGVYLDLTHIPLKNQRENSKDTHLVKQQLPKDVYNSMSEDERKEMPILGNTVVWGSSGNSVGNAPEPEEIDESDDLPF